MARIPLELISDDELRASVAQDVLEIDKAVSGELPKAAAILAGSVLEAILTDNLLNANFSDLKKNPTEMALGDLIDTCHSKGLISERTKNLSHAIRDYRNLIHPGKARRLQERVHMSLASVMVNLVELICNELIENQGTKGTPTLEQIVAKLRIDPAAAKMISRLAHGLSTPQLERLVTEKLPKAYIEEFSISPSDFDYMNALLESYRILVRDASAVAKARIVSEVTASIQNGESWLVGIWLTQFFEGAFFEFADDRQKSLILERLLVELRSRTYSDLDSAVRGSFPFLDENQIKRVLRTFAFQATRFPRDDFLSSSSMIRHMILYSMKESSSPWIEFLKSDLETHFYSPRSIEWLKKIIERGGDMEDDIPF